MSFHALCAWSFSTRASVRQWVSSCLSIEEVPLNFGAQVIAGDGGQLELMAAFFFVGVIVELLR
jgi:hypothetical protein